MNKVLLNLLKGNTLLFVVMFVNSILLARFYTTEEISIIRTLTLYGGFITVLATFQIHVSVLKFVSRIPEDYFRIVGSIKFVTILSFVLTVLYYVVVIIGFRESINFGYYLMYGLSLIPIVFFSMLQNFYIITDQSKKFSGQILVFGLIFVSLTFIIGYFNLSLNYYFGGLFITYSIMLIPWKRHILKSKINDISISEIQDQIKYSTPLTLSNLLYLCISRFDKIWMTITYSANIVGSYFVVAFENPLNGIVIGSSMNEVTYTMSNLLNERKYDELWEKWQDSIFQITSILFLPSVLLFVNAGLFVELVFGEKYIENILVFKLYCLAPLVRTASYQSLLRVFGHTKFHLVNTLIGFIITLIFGAIIMGFFNYRFFALAYLIGFISYNMGVILYICAKEKRSFAEVYGLTVIVKQVTIVLFVFAVYQLLDLESMNFLLKNLIVVVTYLIIFLMIFKEKVKKILYENPS